MKRKQSFYDSPEWQKARLTQLARFPFCEHKGCTERAKHVDHVITVKAAPYRRLDPTNLQSLCETHHNQITNSYDRGTIAGACDEDGFPLDPNHPWNQTTTAEAVRSVNEHRIPDPRVVGKLKRGLSKPRRG